jgi:hypothetical protein
VLTTLGTLMHAEWYVTPDAWATAVRARHAMRSDTSSFNHITVEKMQELLPNKGCPRRYAMDTANLHFNIERKQNGISHDWWFGGVRNSALPTPQVGCDEQQRLYDLLVKCVDGTGEVVVPYGILLDWGAVLGQMSGDHRVEAKEWSHLQTLSGMGTADFKTWASRNRPTLSTADDGVRIPHPYRSHMENSIAAQD